MATTNNNKNPLIDGEPLPKRMRFNDEKINIDLKKLMSQYNSEITNESTTATTTIISSTNNNNKNLPPSQTDAGDSGFQDFTSNDSSLSQKSNVNDDDEDSDEIYDQYNNNKIDNQFTSNVLNNHFDNLLNNHLQDDEDNESIISDLDDINCLSDLEDREREFDKWQSKFGHLSWIHQLLSGTNSKSIIDNLISNNFIPSEDCNQTLLKIIMGNILSEPPKRQKLPHVNNLDDVVDLIKKSKKIIVLTGAGISVASGIPDFRSRDGIYARLSVDFPDLPDPQAMFDINYFRKDQRPFFKFAKEIYPGQFKPSISHKFIKSIENHDKLLRNYTQNIDTLEKSTNIERVITCHGSFSTASCTNCKYKVDGSSIKDDIFAQTIPRCPKCPSDCEALCVMKPDIVFFGESLPDDFHNAMAKDKNECDLLIVIGSSLKVRPVALIPTSIPDDVPQILINREHLSHCVFDVELLGDCDIIIQELCHRLGEGWNEICVSEKLNEIKNFEQIYSTTNEDEEEDDDNKNKSNGNLIFENVLPENSYVCIRPARYLFKGAEISNDSSDDESESDDDVEEPQFKDLNLTKEYNNNNDDLLLSNKDTEFNKPNQLNSFPIDTNNNS